jgi:hypothetical protein
LVPRPVHEPQFPLLSASSQAGADIWPYEISPAVPGFSFVG